MLLCCFSIFLPVTLTSAEFVVVTVAAEVVALAEAAAVALLGVVSDFALAHAAHALPVVAADVRAVVLAAVAVHVLRGHVVAAALAVAAHAPLVAPEDRRSTVSTDVGNRPALSPCVRRKELTCRLRTRRCRCGRGCCSPRRPCGTRTRR